MATREKRSKNVTLFRKAAVAKAGKRAGPYKRPPRSTRSPMERDARYLRRGRLDGAFGAAPTHVWNHLRIGTSGREKVTSRELTARAAAIREAQLAGQQDHEEAS